MALNHPKRPVLKADVFARIADHKINVLMSFSSGITLRSERNVIPSDRPEAVHRTLTGYNQNRRHSSLSCMTQDEFASSHQGLSPDVMTLTAQSGITTGGKLSFRVTG